MRTHIRIVAALALAAICTCAAGQGVTVTDGHLRYTFTDFVTRVPVSLDLSFATGRFIGPNLFCNRIDRDAGRAHNIANLRTGLFLKVYGKSATELNDLLADVNTARGRDAKVAALFGIMRGPEAPVVFQARLDGEYMQQLQMGQEVTLTTDPPNVTWAGNLNPYVCYSTQQIDQAITEGVRVVTAIIQALQRPPAPSKPPAQGFSMDRETKKP